jgi:chaperone BCS1
MNFQSSKGWYDSTGMPYHRSYLLYGPPGTGKSSTLMGLASHFKMSLYLMKLADMDDGTLIAALHNVADNAMIVFEDVDCLNNTRVDLKKKIHPDVSRPEKKTSCKKEEKGDKKAGVTLSGLLNALDGLETPSGSLFFMTTNLIQNLDEALIRPGRVDKKIYLGPATDDQKIEMYHRFFPLESYKYKYENDAEIFVMNHPELKTMAEFQEALKLKRGEE